MRYIAILFFPIVWLLLFPLGRAYLDGIIAARHPSSRVTPRPGWYFFDAVVRLRLKRWRVIWTTLLLLAWLLIPLIFVLFVINDLKDLRADDISLVFNLAATLASSGVLPVMFLALGLMLWAAILILAPRLESIWGLMTLALIVALPPYGLFAWIAAATVPNVNDIQLAEPLILLALAAASAFVVRLWARRRGDAWFLTGE